LGAFRRFLYLSVVASGEQTTRKEKNLLNILRRLRYHFDISVDKYGEERIATIVRFQETETFQVI
jgi:hypothetical protein